MQKFPEKKSYLCIKNRVCIIKTQLSMGDNAVITIGRQFGSGGRELGRKVASLLGIPYFDKEILSRAAEQGGVSEEYLRDNDERAPIMFGAPLPMAMGMSGISWYQTGGGANTESAYSLQSEAIRRIAADGPCVIVGRTADYILRDNRNTLRVFVHGETEDCLDRIMRRGDVDNRAKARQMMEKANKLRAEFYNFFTDRRWGDAASYDMTFNSSRIPLDTIAGIIADRVRATNPNLSKTTN